MLVHIQAPHDAITIRLHRLPRSPIGDQIKAPEFVKFEDLQHQPVSALVNSKEAPDFWVNLIPLRDWFARLVIRELNAHIRLWLQKGRYGHTPEDSDEVIVEATERER